MPDLRFRLLDRVEGQNLRIFTSCWERRRHPHAGTKHDFIILDPPDWVNVIATDPSGAIVLVRQWRAGLDDVTIEIPGGMVEPGEDPIEAARRELVEESGYAGGEATIIGTVRPNPAFQRNACATVLVEGCALTADQDPDPGEVLEVFTASHDEVTEMLRDGRIDHSLVVAAFAHWMMRG